MNAAVLDIPPTLPDRLSWFSTLARIARAD